MIVRRRPVHPSPGPLPPIPESRAQIPHVHAGRSRRVDKPEAGFFLVRKGRKYPWVPARICVDFDEWWAVIDGKQVGGKVDDPLTSVPITDIWHYGREISREEYERRLAATDKPDPNKKIDLRKMGSIF